MSMMILGAVTIVEVLIALLAKGHLVPGIDFKHGIGHYLYMMLMVGFSIYKAYFIVFFFMHMAYEVLLRPSWSVTARLLLPICATPATLPRPVWMTFELRLRPSWPVAAKLSVPTCVVVAWLRVPY